jgi:transcriptional regulator with XRE-family HTH domain
MSATTSPAVGRAIRAKREKAKLPLARIARDSGLTSAELSGIESGTARPSIAVLDRIARAMGSSLVDLVRTANSVGVVAAAPTSARAHLGLSEIARAIAELPDRIGSKLDAAESAAVLHAMSVCQENQSAAARLLGMERKAFVRRLRRARRAKREFSA